VLDAATGKPVLGAPETPVPQDPVAHTYPTQPWPNGDPLVPQVPVDPQDWSGAIAPDGKPYLVATTPYPPYTDQQYVVVAPTVGGGGVEWPDPSYSPGTGFEYVCANVQSSAVEAPPAADQHPVISGVGNVIQLKVASVPNALSISRLVAFNPATNKIVWKHDDVSTGGLPAGHSSACDSPVTTTASGLVLIGRIAAAPGAPNGEGVIQAYDAMSGAMLWQLPVLVNGKTVAVEPRITPYSANGKEYIVSFTNSPQAGPDISAYTLP
jgi:hypothetical protein